MKFSRNNIFSRVFLLLLTQIYFLLSQFHKAFYRLGLLKVNSLPGITVSVGNLAVGGTGKSPIVIELVKFLQAAGYRPAVLTRGYKSNLSKNQFLAVLDGEESRNFSLRSAIFADEAVMQSNLLKRVPVIVGSNRFAAANWYLEQGGEAPTHWILDDGFQHWRLKRDLDIVLLDAKQPFANGFLLPYGRLREPRNALMRANLILFTRSNSQYPIASQYNDVKQDFKVPVCKVEFSTGKLELVVGEADVLGVHSNPKILALAGISNPSDFEEGLISRGLQISSKLYVSDHRRFTRKMVQEKIADCEIIVTTAKDYWREPGFFREFSIPTYILPLRVDSIDSCFSEIL